MKLRDLNPDTFIQDTSELDFSSHRRTQGLGPLSNPAAQGLKVHTVLAASTTGVPLGVLHQKVWARDKTLRSDTRRRASIAQKESARWQACLEVSQTLIPKETRVITVADREADIYELFVHPRCSNSEFLIRAAQNRNTKTNALSADVQLLFAAIRQTPCQGQFTLVLQRTPRLLHPDSGNVSVGLPNWEALGIGLEKSSPALRPYGEDCNGCMTLLQPGSWYPHLHHPYSKNRLLVIHTQLEPGHHFNCRT